MPARPQDRIVVETSAGACEIASSIRLTQDMQDMSQLAISCGDDTAWERITRIFHPGQQARLYVNGCLQFTGRWEINTVPADAHGGVTAELVARPRISDVRYVTAVKTTALKANEDGDLSFQNVSLKAFILALFAPLGYTEADFQFDTTADRNLITGQKTGLPKLSFLEPIQEGRAKVQPGELVWDCFQRHLKRFHLMAWDGADGRIVIGTPDDRQIPLYFARAKRGQLAQSNNVLSPHRIRDWSEVVSEVRVLGSTTGDDGDPKPILGVAGDAEVLATANASGQFLRRLAIPLDGQFASQRLAESRARRELALRSKNKDAWELTLDEWTFWTGSKAIPWAVNTCIDVDVDTIGVDGAGRYLIHKIQRTLDVHGAGTTTLSLVAPGILGV